MEQVGVRRLKQETATLLRRVAAGEALEITDHGHSVARLVPILRSSVDQMLAEDRIRPAASDLKETMRQLGLPRPQDRGGRCSHRSLRRCVRTRGDPRLLGSAINHAVEHAGEDAERENAA
ncbi:MAG: type II toxin-antitoxin system Phd/YefM family antitoxin [Candidatus Dormibacterales bacterium]